MNFKRRQGKNTGSHERGFSLIELMIVLVVMVIVATLVVPNLVQTNANYKLDGAGHSVAGLLQLARLQAVKNNLPAYAKYDNAQRLVFVTDDPTNGYAAGVPEVAITSDISFQNTPPDHSQLDAYAGGASPQVAVTVAFNARGLPCTENGTNAAVCTSVTSGFEWFMQNSRGDWEAVTVTPAGRIKSWRLSMRSNGTTTCGYTACWQ